MNKPSYKGTIVLEYLEKHPKMSYHKLAKIIYADHPSDFNDPEHVRSLIRWYKGSNGWRSRIPLKELGGVNKYNLPDSDEMELEPVVIDGKKFLILADLHSSYYSMEALTMVIDFAQTYKPDVVIFLGDLIDFYQISKFTRDPTRKTVPEEIEFTKKLVLTLKEKINANEWVFKYGNHDERLRTFICNHAKELYGLIGTSLEEQLEELNLTHVPDKRRVRVGKLDLVHGHELFRGVYSPVNPARGLFLKTHKTSACGHAHITSEHTEPRLNGEIVTTWSIGCLCSLQQDYSPYGKVNHGFATVDLKENGMFSFKNYRIQNGEIL